MKTGQRQFESGYLYLVRAEGADVAKIGFAKTPADRLRQLQTGNHAKLRIEFAIPCEKNAEAALHRLLAPRRLQGEWFSGAEFLEELFCEVDTEFADLQLEEMLNGGTSPEIRSDDIERVFARLTKQTSQAA